MISNVLQVKMISTNTLSITSSETTKTIFVARISVQFKMPCAQTIQMDQNSSESAQISQIWQYSPRAPHHRRERGREGRHQAALFYADDGMLASSDHQWLQWAFTQLVGLFDRVGLNSNSVTR